jgi:hypothetical protein
MRKLLVKIRTSFGSCICDYADRSSGDTSTASESFENDSLKDDKTSNQKAEEGKHGKDV